MKKNLKDIKLVYVDAYVRATGKKGGVFETSHVHIHGAVDGCFSEGQYHAYLKDIEKRYASDGYTDIAFSPCSREEFESDGMKEGPLSGSQEGSLLGTQEGPPLGSQQGSPEGPPIGYLRIYLRIDCVKDNQEKVGVSQGKYDFHRFVDEGLWDSFALEVKRLYESKGFGSIVIMSATKELSDAFFASDGEWELLEG